MLDLWFAFMMSADEEQALGVRRESKILRGDDLPAGEGWQAIAKTTDGLTKWVRWVSDAVG